MENPRTFKEKVWQFVRELSITAKYFPANIIPDPEESIYNWANRFGNLTNTFARLADFQACGFSVMNIEGKFDLTEIRYREMIEWLDAVPTPHSYLMIYGYHNRDRLLRAIIFRDVEHMTAYRLTFSES